MLLLRYDGTGKENKHKINNNSNNKKHAGRSGPVAVRAHRRQVQAFFCGSATESDAPAQTAEETLGARAEWSAADDWRRLSPESWGVFLQEGEEERRGRADAQRCSV